MTAKVHILEMIRNLPDEVGYEEIARKIEFITGIRETQEQIASGGGLCAEEILKEMPEWITKS